MAEVSNPYPPIYRLRASVVDSEPAIWRLLEVSSGLRLSEVHDVMQIAFGWQHRHLHAFEHSDGGRYLDRGSIDEGLEGMDEQHVALGDVWRDGDGPLTYTYDFGDGWDHLLELVETVPGGSAGDRPASLIRGAQGGPLEDSGGIHGYQEILATLTDPGAPDRDDVRAWVRGSSGPWDPPFDAEAVDVDRVNRMLGFRFAEHPPVGWRTELQDLLYRMPPGVRVPFGEHLREAELDRAVIVDAADAQAAVRPYAWLLRRLGQDGIRLTQAGWLPPAVVSAAMHELGWESRWVGNFNREDQTPPIAALRSAAIKFGLVRKLKGSLLATAAARGLPDDPLGLWRHVATRWLSAAGPGFPRDLRCLVTAEVASGTLDEAVLISRAVYGLSALGWSRSDGWMPLSEDDVKWEVRRELLDLSAMGGTEYEDLVRRPDLSASARSFARAALQSR